MLRWRLVSAISVISVLVAIFFLESYVRPIGMWLLPLTLFLSLGATHELIHLFDAGKLPVHRKSVYFGCLLMILSSWFFRFGLSEAPSHWEAWAGPAIAFGISLLIVFWMEVLCYQEPERTIPILANSMFAICYVGWLSTFVVQHRWIGFSGTADGSCGLAALITLLIVVKLGDVGAYVTGAILKLGRTKLAPKVSPGKSIEGVIGGLLFSVAGAWFALTVLAPRMSEIESWTIAWPVWVSFGIVVNLAGIIGDLGESLLKRAVGQKDSSNWLLGLGGLLDMLDSVLVAAPVSYLFWVFGWLTP